MNASKLSRQQGLARLPALAAVALGGMLSVVTMMDWVVVEIDAGVQGPEFTVAAPLALFGALARAPLPAEAREALILPPEVLEHRELVVELAQALDEVGDVVLVEVVSPDAIVLVAIEDGRLKISVDSPEANVRVEVPVDALVEFLDDVDERLEPRMLIDFLAEVEGQLVQVDTADGVHVSVRVS